MYKAFLGIPFVSTEQTGQRERREECLPSWHRSSLKEMCILLLVHLMSQPCCRPLVVVAQQGAIGNAMGVNLKLAAKCELHRF